MRDFKYLGPIGVNFEWVATGFVLPACLTRSREHYCFTPILWLLESANCAVKETQ